MAKFRQGFGIDPSEREIEHGPNPGPVCCLNRRGLGFRLSF
jgi:hypothetical protein